MKITICDLCCKRIYDNQICYDGKFNKTKKDIPFFAKGKFTICQDCMYKLRDYCEKKEQK